jgi:hypothetical protein
VWGCAIFVKEFGEKYFTADGITLFSKLCEVKVKAEKHFTVQQHCNTAKHKSCVNREFAARSRQRLLFEKSHDSSSVLGSAYEFSKDLCKMMVLSNIPLRKVEAASFRKFLEKYTTHPIPTESHCIGQGVGGLFGSVNVEQMRWLDSWHVIWEVYFGI